MKKKLCIIWGMLISFGMFSACSNNDDLSDLMDSKMTLFEDSLQSIREYDYTGYLYYDNHYGWSIIPGIPYDYSSIYYFPVNLPEKLKSCHARVRRICDCHRIS